MAREPYGNVAEFARWFLSQPIRSLRPPADASFTLVTTGGRVEGITLFRRGQFQVELFNNPPDPHGSGFPEHRHPNVDSIEFFLAGEIDFTIRGKALPRDVVYGVAEDGAARLCGTVRRVRPTDYHGATVGTKGGVFMSIQQWLNGVPPSSVVLDWIGPPHVEVRRSSDWHDAPAEARCDGGDVLQALQSAARLLGEIAAGTVAASDVGPTIELQVLPAIQRATRALATT
ncbi:MAG TPA: hypothetical protein VIL43_06880 [Burkholderiales bacterium]